MNKPVGRGGTFSKVGVLLAEPLHIIKLSRYQENIE